ncbi:MAG: hypothetical protein ACHBN1_15535 [Heteroscytonema crispum UTEX LB 1556]
MKFKASRLSSLILLVCVSAVPAVLASNKASFATSPAPDPCLDTSGSPLSEDMRRAICFRNIGGNLGDITNVQPTPIKNPNPICLSCPQFPVKIQPGNDAPSLPTSREFKIPNSLR